MRQKDLVHAERTEPNISNHSEKPSSDSCDECGASLTLIRFKLFGEEIVLRPACECRLKELETRERQARIDGFHRLIRNQGLEDGLYARMTLEKWEFRDPSCEAVADKLKSYIRNAHLGARNWLYLFGDYGLGKSHLAVSALKSLCFNREWEPLLVRWSEYCTRIQQSWQNSSPESDYGLWQRARNVTLLLLDDIDKRAPTEWALGKLYELIDYRSLRLLPTILTANRNFEDLSFFWSRNEQTQDLAGAIVSRIVGQLSDVIEFSGRDYRFGNL